MLNFRTPQLCDRELIKQHFYEGTADGTCYSFGSLLIWGSVYSVEITEYGDLLLMRGMYGDERYYVYPSGKGDIKGAILAMMEESEKDGFPFVFSQLLPEHKKTIEELFPDYFDFVYARDDAEYIYSVKNMAELPGKRFHGKKGHVNAFFRNHTDIHVDPITEDNIHLCLEIASQWLDDREDETGELCNEFGAIERAVKYYKELGFIGAVLYADGKPVAFTMGEPLKNNTFCTHFEKTTPDYRDAYPVINNGFTKLMLSTYEFVNREEDTGVPGLRQAKMSYNPVFLLDKYFAYRKDEPHRKFRADKADVPSLKELWKTVFGDDDSVIDFFFEHAADCRDAYVYKVDGKIVSAFYLLDADILINNQRKKSKYLYAAATLPAYRRNGYMGEMIQYAFAYLQDIGYEYTFLCPAEQPLFDYYAKFGFVPAFKEKFYEIDKDGLAPYKNARYFHSAVSYSDLRANIPSASFVQFTDGFIDFAAFCNHRYGVRRDAVFDDEARVVVLGHTEKDTTVIDEALTENGTYSHILSVLADFDAEKIILKTPDCICLPGLSFYEEYSGMILNLKNEIAEDSIYLGQPCL